MRSVGADGERLDCAAVVDFSDGLAVGHVKDLDAIFGRDGELGDGWFRAGDESKVANLRVGVGAVSAERNATIGGLKGFVGLELLAFGCFVGEFCRDEFVGFRVARIVVGERCL